MIVRRITPFLILCEVIFGISAVQFLDAIENGGPPQIRTFKRVQVEPPNNNIKIAKLIEKDP